MAEIDSLSPRSSLHFIKYITKDDQTSKLWECGICGKDFKHQYTLVRHLPVHTDERKFQCDKCPKSFRQRSTLYQHKASKHSNNKPYVCEHCHKSFTRVSILINHKKIHSDTKRYACHICEKAFHQKINLQVHLNTHTNLKPYKCANCDKGFNQKSNLTNHLRSCSERNLAANSSVEARNSVNSSMMFEKQEKSATYDGEVVIEEKNTTIEVVDKNEFVKLKESFIGEKHSEAVLGYDSGVLISPIGTPEYNNAVMKGQIPFVLFQPCRGTPIIAKVQSLGGVKHLLTPISA